MLDKKQIIIDILRTIAVFIVCWGAIQALPRVLPNDCHASADLLFMVLYMGFAGIFLPIGVAKKHGFSLHESAGKTSRVAGIVILILVTTISCVQSGSLDVILEMDISILVYLKYVFLFVPMTFAISLTLFHLVAEGMSRVMGDGIGHRFLATGLIGLLLGVGFFADTLGEMELTVVMGVLGLFYGAGAVLVRSVFIVWPLFFVSVYCNTLAELKYVDHNPLVLIIGTLTCGGFAYLSMRNRR